MQYTLNHLIEFVGDVVPVVVAKLGVMTSRMRILWVDIVFLVAHTLIM